MNTAVAKTPRDFTYIKARKRRVSEYEAVSLYVQPDPGVFDKQGWYLRTPEGRTAWRIESTALRHPHWFDFRDPASHWQRTYVRDQAEQERTVERATEDAAKNGSLKDIDRTWVTEILGGHYRVWSFHEYGLFRCFAQAQREALSDTIGNVLCFEGVDRMRHAQAIVIQLMDLEDHIEGFRDAGAKERWTGDPIYQPLRRLTEELMAVDDWAELAIAVNLVVDPIVAEVGLSQLVRRPAPLHGDPVTALLVSTTERDRRRNQAWTEELVRMVTGDAIPARDENREVLRGWIDRWLPRAIAAAEPLVAVHDKIPLRPGSFDEGLARAKAGQRTIVAALGLARGAQS